MADPVLRLNLAMSLAILAVLLLRRPARNLLGGGVAYGLWAVVPAAMLATLAPARVIHLAASVLRAPSHPPAIAARVLEGQSSAQAWVQQAPVHTAFGAAGHPIPWTLVLTGIWLVGVVVSLGLTAWRQARFMDRLGGLSRDPGGPGLYHAGRPGGGPALVGVLFPRIVLPADFETLYDAQEREVMIAHEMAHRRRGDSRVNALVALTQCLAWYNPLVQLGARALRIDQELACDQVVMARRPAARRLYAEVLLKSQLAQMDLPLGCYWPARAERPLKTRLALLASPPKGKMTRRVGAGLAGVVVLGAGVAAWAAQPAHVVLAPARTLAAAATPMTAPVRAETPATPAAPSEPATQPLRPADNAAPAEAAAPAVSAPSAELGPPRPVDPNDLHDVMASGGTVAQALAAAQAHQYFSFLTGGVDAASARIVSAYGGGRALGVMGPDGPVYLSFPDGATGPVCTIPKGTVEYDAKAPVTLTGVIIRVDWVSPRTVIHMRASEPGKPEQSWEILAGSPNTMQRAGVDRDSLKEGATVTIRGYRSKDGSCPTSAADGGPSCHVAGRDVDFTDGRRVFLGATGGLWDAVIGGPAGAESWDACPGWKGAGPAA